MAADPSTTTRGAHLTAFAAPLLALGATLAALGLSLKHLTGINLPGCGAESHCGQAASSAWGKVPLFDWPVSHLGVAYFAALTLALLFSRANLTAPLRWIVRLGAIMSLVYIGVIVANGWWCAYCLTAHACNLLLLAVLELSRPRQSGTASALAPQLAAFAALGIITTSGLWVAEARLTERAREIAATEQAESTDAIIAQHAEQAEDTDSSDDIVIAPQDTGEASDPGAATLDSDAFIGRYPKGPDLAAIRIVAFIDFQCEDCQRVETEINQFAQGRDDVQVSLKHFPFSNVCNPNVPVNKHPNACWAARGAEAAGILHGPDGFWAMADWLIKQKGAFTTDELKVGLAELGFDADPIIELMTSDATAQPVQADIEESLGLGLHYTPMVFVNGVELRGWQFPGAVESSLKTIAASNPPLATAASDKPRRAGNKYVDDWRQQPVRAQPADTYSWPMGPEDAPVEIVLYGDYRGQVSVAADIAIRKLMEQRDDIRYTFRHFPASELCNPVVRGQNDPLSCLTARLSVASGLVGGASGFASMHAWLHEHRDEFMNYSVRQIAEATGLPAESLGSAMRAPEVDQALKEDVDASQELHLTSVPMVFVAGKFLPRWRLDGYDVLGEVVKEAAENAASSP